MKKFCAVFMLLSVLLLAACAGREPQTPPTIAQGSGITLFAGQDFQLTANTPGTWSSSDPEVAEVAADGFLRGRKEGIAVVTLTVGGQTASITVTVTPYVPVTELRGDEMITVKAGVPKRMNIQVFPENASDPGLRYEIFPNDGTAVFDGDVLTVAEAVAPGTIYEITAINDRSAVSCVVKVRVSELKGRTAWTIGDSIFDFRDNSDTDVVQTMLRDAGYTNFYMDNIAGSTVRAASNVGIMDHLDSGMYEAWPEPELIIIFRGTNDVYYSIQQPNFFTRGSVVQAIEDTCRRLRQMYPDARILWATPLWRADVSPDKLDWIRDVLHSTCPEYDVEVFDLHLTENFRNLSHENFGTVLYDGIHLTDLGAQYMRSAFVEYLKQ